MQHALFYRHSVAFSSYIFYHIHMKYYWILFISVLLTAGISGCNSIAPRAVAEPPANEHPEFAHAIQQLYADPIGADFTFAKCLLPYEGQRYWDVALAAETASVSAMMTAETVQLPSIQPSLHDNPAKLILIEEKDALAPETTDLWSRIRTGYALDVQDNHYIQQTVKRYIKSPRHIGQLTSRAEPYLFHIVREVERRGMPLEIALLPAVESAYQPKAKSPRAAAGLWQFMPDTGRQFGLKQNAWYDGRQDIIASTRAALDYLQQLHRQFDGDWLNALAAYNYGEGNVLKAMRKNRKLGKETDYWSLDLPTETRYFVPKLLAIAKIVDKPHAYGVRLNPIPNQPYFTPVEFNYQVDLLQAAKLAGLSRHDFERLNPAYRQWKTAPQGPHRINVPVQKVAQFKKQLHNIIAVERQVRGFKPTVRYPQYSQYRVKRGDTLGHIAKRYNTTVKVLRRLNHKQLGKYLKVGQILRVPAVRKQRVAHTVRR